MEGFSIPNLSVESQSIHSIIHECQSILKCPLAIVRNKDAHIKLIDLANRLLKLFFGKFYQESLIFEVVVNLHKNVVYLLKFGSLFLLLAISTVN